METELRECAKNVRWEQENCAPHSLSCREQELIEATESAGECDGPFCEQCGDCLRCYNEDICFLTGVKHDRDQRT